jgi:hypothetical protein
VWTRSKANRTAGRRALCHPKCRFANARPDPDFR